MAARVQPSSDTRASGAETLAFVKLAATAMQRAAACLQSMADTDHWHRRGQELQAAGALAQKWAAELETQLITAARARQGRGES